jgi:hypothetical protein
MSKPTNDIVKAYLLSLRGSGRKTQLSGLRAFAAALNGEVLGEDCDTGEATLFLHEIDWLSLKQDQIDNAMKLRVRSGKRYSTLNREWELVRTIHVAHWAESLSLPIWIMPIEEHIDEISKGVNEVSWMSTKYTDQVMAAAGKRKSPHCEAALLKYALSRYADARIGQVAGAVLRDGKILLPIARGGWHEIDESDPDLEDYIRSWLEIRQEGHGQRDGPLFCRIRKEGQLADRDRHLSTNALRKTLRKDCRAAKVRYGYPDGFTWESLRSSKRP